MKKNLIFFSNVQNLRKAKGFTQAELAEKIGIHANHISQLESGRFPRDPERIVAIAQALECGVEDLFKSPPKAGAEAEKIKRGLSSEQAEALAMLGEAIARLADLQRRVIKKPALAARLLVPLQDTEEHVGKICTAS